MSELGMPDLQGLLEQAEFMQSQLAEAQAELERTEVSGSAGSGLVTARVTGVGELIGLSIDPRIFVSNNASELAEVVADLVVAAVRNASRAAEELREHAMGPLTDAFGAFAGPV